MGNYISRISKGHFFAFEEELKNEIFFSKERQEVSSKCVLGAFKSVCSITNWDVVERPFLNRLGV